MTRHATSRDRTLLCLMGLVTWGATWAEAGVPLGNRRARPVVPTADSAPPGPYPGLGTYYPTPYMTILGDWPTGDGYTPLNSFGDATLSLYGPISALRATAAPVVTYARGYDGRPVAVPGTSFSTPNLPGATPVVYPTQATNYYGFRHTVDPPWWPNGINWIDQN
ncbi:MAG: hypothetical protein JOZ63_16925 [Planctomycetaceae bacterium]|nr:hypothetical protein [Planctomycetaceae bacterium]